MTHPGGERTTEKKSEDPQPAVGTDPERSPQEGEDGGRHRVVAPDAEEVKEHERERRERRQHETPEEGAERTKSA